ncbi:MAG: dihydroxyacetone kinase subunit DhaK [Clostridiales Family XIII bacterium]|jgi:dihydroxyacetone kinase|nr:dihydroxyacetone kinase subunit DhaK [Clostridiales Family XIII bacterium]
MKKILNDVNNLVIEMAQGIVLSNPNLTLNEKYKVIARKHINKDKVSLISGGGSGHEPAHAGFVGKGMLDAAVCGDVFASPSQIQVYQAIKQVATDEGVLLIIKNYSGDVMNFKNAAYLAEEDGIRVEYIKVDDDIAVQDSLYTVGHRGVAGTVLVHKIVGAAAEAGKSLDELKAIGEKVIANVRSIGFALESVTVPAKGTPTFSLGDDEVEYGVGIHGEPGIRREKLQTADEYAQRMVDAICADLGLDTADASDAAKSQKSTRVAVLVNGFGASPLMELYVLNNSVIRELNARGITVSRNLVGNYMTSLDMAGASLTILKLDDELDDLLHQPCETLALTINDSPESHAISEYTFGNSGKSLNADATAFSYTVETPIKYSKIGETVSLENMIYIVDVMSESIIKNEVPFCELDSFAGDGDFGMSVAKGFRKLKEEWADILAGDHDDIGSFLNECALIIMEYCGGASGPIWGSAFRAASKSTLGKNALTPQDFAQMLEAAVSGIQLTGERSFGRGAVVGDKTLIDALAPCAEKWAELTADENVSSTADPVDFVTLFAAGAEAAALGAKNTEQIVARMGRAGTVGERSLGHPDAGAYALGVIFADITNALKQA